MERLKALLRARSIVELRPEVREDEEVAAFYGSDLLAGHSRRVAAGALAAALRS